MSNADDYFADTADDRSPALPSSVRALRLLLFLTAAFTLFVLIGGILAAGLSAARIGALVWVSWPGALGFVVAVRIKRTSRTGFWLVIVVSGVLAFGSLSELGRGDPGGVFSLILPALILVFVLRRPSRDHFLRRKTVISHLSPD